MNLFKLVIKELINELINEQQCSNGDEFFECTSSIASYRYPPGHTECIEKKIAETGTPKALLNFNCILRRKQLEKQGQTEEYGRIFEVVPTIGFNTYGEAYIGHINQSATMLVFG